MKIFPAIYSGGAILRGPTADGTNGQAITTDGAGNLAFSTIGGGAAVTPGYSGGRLTLASGDPCPTADQIGKTTIYFTPYVSTRVSLYTGSAWTSHTFAEMSLALGTLTDAKNYDVFLDYNDGTPQLTLSAAWTNGTTRADALTTQDGVLVKSGDTQQLYLGTFRTTATTTTEDSGTGTQLSANIYTPRRLLWNNYNRVHRPICLKDLNGTHTYTTAAWRVMRADANNRVDYLAGVAGVATSLFKATCCATNTSAARSCAIGIDGTTPAGTWDSAILTTGQGIASNGQHAEQIPIGYHYANWLQFSAAVGGTTWYTYSTSAAFLTTGGVVGFVEA